MSMRTVMSVANVAAVWGKQARATTPQRNFRIEGTTAYSYATPIGWRMGWGVVMNITSYTKTTHRHSQALWRNAVPSSRSTEKVYMVDNIPMGWRGEVTPEFVAGNYAQRIDELTAQLARRKSDGQLARNWLRWKGADGLSLAKEAAAIETQELRDAKARLLAEISRLGQIVGSLPDEVANQLC
jgi:hypothetical protein